MSWSSEADAEADPEAGAFALPFPLAALRTLGDAGPTALDDAVGRGRFERVDRSGRPPAALVLGVPSPKSSDSSLLVGMNPTSGLLGLLTAGLDGGDGLSHSGDEFPSLSSS